MAKPPCPTRRRRPAVARLWREQRGATAVEYGLIIGAVVITMLIGLVPLARLTVGMWGNVNTQVTTSSNR